jgi:hypothetical protein
MKGVNIFIVVLILLFFISNVSAVSHTGEVDLQLSEDAPDWALQNGHTYGSGISIYAFKYKGVADAGIPNTLVFRDASMSRQAAYAWVDIPQNVGGSFALYDNGVFAGTGGITVHRVNNVDVGRVDIWYQFDDSDFVVNTSETIMDVTLYGSPIGEYYSQFPMDYYLHPYATQNVEMQFKSGSYVGTHSSWSTGASSYVEYDYYGHFINEYNITLSGATASTVITRDGLGQQLSSSRLKLTNSTGSTVYLPSSYSTTNSTHNHDNGSYYYYLDVENYGEVLIYNAITAAGPSVGTIDLNQTSYTEPELIQIDAELTTYDFDDHIYRTLMEYSTDDGANWERLSVAFNSTSVMSSTTECRTATIDSSYYALPIKIRAVIDDYNKLTSSSSTIATSSEVYYNPPSAYDYTFEGMVFDASTFAPIYGATVSATGVTDTSTTTTPTGTFKLYLSEGVYTITGSMSGYVDNVNEDIVIAGNIVYFNIYLTQTSYTNHTVNGVIKDTDTDYALQDVHIIFTNATDTIDAYSTATGYYSADGFAQSSTYIVSALKSGYYTYNGSVTTAASGATYKAFDMVPETATPTPTPTVGLTATYPGGEGHEWTNDEIVTMLRVLVPGFFLLMLVFLLLAVMLGIGGNNGNGGQRGLGLDEIWKR